MTGLNVTATQSAVQRLIQRIALSAVIVVNSYLIVRADEAETPTPSRTNLISRFAGAGVSDASVAVRVRNAALAHTTQLFPDVTESKQVDAQITSLLMQLDRLLKNAGVDRGSLVKLNVYVRDADVRRKFEETLTSWARDAQPAVAFVATPLPVSDAVVALDAVFSVKNSSKTGVPYHVTGQAHGGREGAGQKQAGRYCVLPPGDVVYVSGQASPGELADATTATLKDLLKTIHSLGLDQSHIVQIKTFMTPMSRVDIVDQKIVEFFGDLPVPPVSHVEWISGSRPIEIELVAWAPPADSESTVSYLTPEWMTSSPVFSRVARIHGDDRIYVSGLESPQTETDAGDKEVRDVFGLLKRALTAAGSDLQHLAKATYYVTDGDTSGHLGAVRTEYYHPERPPAASKAMVADVGISGRNISLDMIAAPARRSGESQSRSTPLQNGFRISADVDFGADRGQSFGSIFEVRNRNGRVIAGAGFADAYNTRFRTGRRTLQFFVRPDSGNAAYEVERLPHPDLDTGVYLCEYDQEIYAWSYVRGNSVRKWDRQSGSWLKELPPGLPAMRSGDGVMRLGKGRLAFSNSTAWYDDRKILSPPEEGRFYNFYYADNHLFFYHRSSDAKNLFTRLVACPCTVNENGIEPISMESAIVFETKYDQETPFAWGQYDGQILTVSNQGGIYVFEDGRWRTTLAADKRYSYQVYSALRWYDRLLLAQYPTGNIFEYRGEQAIHRKDWPPVMPGVSPSARECQTLAIYGGELLAGVWPWAELWTHDRDSERWRFSMRMFTHPEPTTETVHPYEAETDRFNLVRNHWGQRITSLVPQGDSLLVATSSKGTERWDDRYDFLTETQRREYGAVLKLRLPGNLAVQPAWTDGVTRLEFIFDGQTMTVLQEGEKLQSTSVGDQFDVDLAEVRVNWSRGIFGPLDGQLVRGRFQQ